MPTQSRRGGVPTALAAFPLRTFRPRDATATYPHPRTQLARLAEQGALLRVAPGHYIVVPQEHVGTTWTPSLEVVAAGIAAADFGLMEAMLMGVSAARMHGAIPRALTTAIVASPVQRKPLRLIDREGTIQFVMRDTGRLDVESVPTELGRALVTTPEQTVLDLARRPELGGSSDQVTEAIRALLPRSDPDTLVRLADAQRMRKTLKRVQRLSS